MLRRGFSIQSHDVIDTWYEPDFIGMQLDAGAGKSLDHCRRPKRKAVIDLQRVPGRLGCADVNQVSALLLVDSKILHRGRTRSAGQQEQPERQQALLYLSFHRRKFLS